MPSLTWHVFDSITRRPYRYLAPTIGSSIIKLAHGLIHIRLRIAYDLRRDGNKSLFECSAQ
ncbi:hypothetical protein NK6_2881 [Bradyrhizobium diazoefficiens]|uniref:Uncharacterized protein n=1 Tax=Bradyrhizobium diazoefficiens TaxID=1355477 RepID=A0A0E4BNA5_9BRAD|nr:hypothetical protein NK6_2881 [Bradyrhizobium diazoefficiens]